MAIANLLKPVTPQRCEPQKVFYMKKVELNGNLGKGKFALVDDEDFELVSKHKWYFTRYANSSIFIKGSSGKFSRRGKSIKFSMHRLIMNAPKGMEIDHIDNNGLNNQKSNLRICTHADNMRNIQKYKKKTSSKYKGVCWGNHDKKWLSYIRYNNKRFNLGHYNNEIEAAKVYDMWANELHGEFAVLNFQPSP